MSKPRHIAIVIDLQWTLKHHHETFAGAYQYAQERGWACTVWPQPPSELKTGRSQAKYDGIIARATPELARAASDARIPLVNVWVSSLARGVPTVIQDVVRAGEMAGTHLAARGIRRFGYVGIQRTEACRGRMEGFRREAAKVGGSFRRLLGPVTLNDRSASWERFHSSLVDWIEGWEPPFGVFTANDMLARYVANAAHECGLRVPADVAILGSGNETVACLQPDPTLSSIDYGYHRVGYRAAATLDELMGGASPGRPVIVPPAEIAARASTDAYAVEDELVARALRFMADESHRPIKVRDVVEHVHASHRSLARHFRQARGRSIIEELARIRLGRARRLLVESDAPVKEVAAACGYGTSNRLCESFRKAEGVTPGEYRAKHGLKGKDGAVTDG